LTLTILLLLVAVVADETGVSVIPEEDARSLAAKRALAPAFPDVYDATDFSAQCAMEDPLSKSAEGLSRKARFADISFLFSNANGVEGAGDGNGEIAA